MPAVRDSGRTSGRLTARGPALIAAGALALSGMIGAGCQRPLYLPKDSRTQYDRYLRARNELAAPFVEDEYGRRTPNLRERLGPRR